MSDDVWSEATDLKFEVANLEAKLEAVESDRNMSRGVNEQMIAERHGSRRGEEEAIIERDDALRKIAELEATVAKRDESIEKLIVRGLECGHKASELESKVDELESKVDELESKVIELESIEDKLEGQIQFEGFQRAQLKDEVLALQDRLAELEPGPMTDIERDSLWKKINGLKADVISAGRVSVDEIDMLEDHLAKSDDEFMEYARLIRRFERTEKIHYEERIRRAKKYDDLIVYTERLKASYGDARAMAEVMAIDVKATEDALLKRGEGES